MAFVNIIGAGVSGLTSALRLLEAGHVATILSAEDPAETTSSVAAALWFPFRAYPVDKVIGWSLESLSRFLELEQVAGTGIRTRDVRELWRVDPPPPGWRSGLSGFRELSSEEVPAGFRGGFAMRVPVIDSSRYLPYLIRAISERGGKIENLELDSLADPRLEGDVIVNCSGTGARGLANDESVVAIRGQIVRVEGTRLDHVTLDEGSEQASYVVPRETDCVLGTTVEEDVWDRTISNESTADILNRCIDLDAAVGGAKVLESRVGLRPGRPSVRLELDRNGPKPVVHNYGHGGSGFTLSWGCADEVVRLVASVNQ